MKEHRITLMPSGNIQTMADPLWGAANPLKIDCFPWDDGNSKPNTEVRLVASDAWLTLLFETDEAPVLARFRKPNDPVCRDSCMEFFFRPCAGDPRYMNFEINPFGTPYIGLGSGRSDSKPLHDIDLAEFGIQTEIHEQGWKLMFAVPFAFLKRYFETVDFQWHANFYKCGDDKRQPSWGCWNPIKSDRPDFHRPECFGVIST